MTADATADLIESFLGSTHIFALALSDVLEEDLLDKVAAGHLTPAQMKVLKLISEAKEPTVSDVAKFLAVSNAAASKAIDRLVRRAFLKRIEGKADRRSSELAVTAAGRRVLAEFEEARRRWLAQVFQKISAEHLQLAAGVLYELASSIVATSANPENVCLQCGVYFKDRCLLHDEVRGTCQYRQRKSRQGTQLPQRGKTT